MDARLTAPTTERSIAGSIDAFLSGQRLAQTSAHTYACALRHLARHLCPEWDISTVTTPRLASWCRVIAELGPDGMPVYSARTVRVYYAAAASYCRWLVDSGHVAESPLPGPDAFPGGRLPRIVRTPQPACPSLSAQACIAACDQLPAYEAALTRAALYILWEGQARHVEILGIQVGDVRLDDGPAPHIQLVRTKGDKPRKIWFSDAAATALRRYAALRPRHAPHSRFLSYERPAGAVGRDGLVALVRRAWTLAGLDPLDKRLLPHAWRRGGSTHDHLTGVPLAVVSANLGHSSLATTQIYIQIREEDQARYRNQRALQLQLPSSAPPGPPEREEPKRSTSERRRLAYTRSRPSGPPRVRQTDFFDVEE